MIRARYSYTLEGPAPYPVIAIVDHDEGRTVTNDAEAVIADLAAAGFDLSTHRVIYRDTRGVWDELATEGGRFASYRALAETDLARALAKVTP